MARLRAAASGLLPGGTLASMRTVLQGTLQRVAIGAQCSAQRGDSTVQP